MASVNLKRDGFSFGPYSLDNARPDLTTMPTDARTVVCTPSQVIERWLGGDKKTSTTSDDRIVTHRNQSLLINDADMLSTRTMFTKHSMAYSHQQLVLKTPNNNRVCVEERFVETYCERSEKVAAVFVSPLVRGTAGVSLRELAYRHYNRLVLDWTGDSDGLMVAKVFMFVKDHLAMTEGVGRQTDKMHTAPRVLPEEMRSAHFNTEDADELKADLRVHKAMREIAMREIAK